MNGVSQPRHIPYHYFESAALNRESLRLQNIFDEAGRQDDRLLARKRQDNQDFNQRHNRELHLLHERHDLELHPKPRELDPDFFDDDYRRRALELGTPTGTNSMGGRLLETGTPLDDRPDDSKSRKRETTWEMMVRKQINDSIRDTAALLGDLNARAAEYGRLAAEALAAMHEIDAQLRAADDVIDAYTDYQVNGTMDRAASIRALRGRNVHVRDDMTDKELLEILREESRRAIDDQIRLAEEHEARQKEWEYYLRQEELTRRRARELEEKRNAIFADKTLTPDEQNRALADLYEEYSHGEVVQYGLSAPNANVVEVNTVLKQKDEANANVGKDADFFADAFDEPVRSNAPAAQPTVPVMAFPKAA